MQTVGNNFLGAPLAGLLIGFGAAATLGAPALLYAVAGLALLGMRGRFRVENPSTRPLRADIVDGLRYLWGHRVLRALSIFAGVLNFANAAYFAVFVLWVVGEDSRVGLHPGGYGVLATLAFGGDGLPAGRRLARRAGQVRVLITADLVNSLLLLVPVLVPTVAAIGVTAVLLGATNAASNVLLVSLRQRLVPEELLGRVHATNRLIAMGATPLGAAAGGLLARGCRAARRVLRRRRPLRRRRRRRLPARHDALGVRRGGRGPAHDDLTSPHPPTPRPSPDPTSTSAPILTSDTDRD